MTKLPFCLFLPLTMVLIVFIRSDSFRFCRNPYFEHNPLLSLTTIKQIRILQMGVSFTYLAFAQTFFASMIRLTRSFPSSHLACLESNYIITSIRWLDWSFYTMAITLWSLSFFTHLSIKTCRIFNN